MTRRRRRYELLRKMKNWIPLCGDCGGEREKLAPENWSEEIKRRYSLFSSMGKKIEQVVYCKRCNLESILFEAEEF
jgi:hypothetical protein